MIGIDMKMPKACLACNLEIWHNGSSMCAVITETTDDVRSKTRHPNCPLHLLGDQILVGDEVRDCGDVGVVTYVWEDGDVDVVMMNGRVATWGEENVERTGRHFDDVVMMLQKMRGEDDA